VLDKKHFKNFEKIVGAENIFDDKPHMIAYSYDATRDRYEPDAVLFPKDENDVSQILKYCNENQIIITPRGAGSGFTGGALPKNGGIILAFEKHMNKILEIDEKNMLAIVQPGVINMDLQTHVEELGLFYPPDPASNPWWKCKRKCRWHESCKIWNHKRLCHGSSCCFTKWRYYQGWEKNYQRCCRIQCCWYLDC